MAARTTLGERIRTAREQKDLDQIVLSSKIDVATRTLQRWEKGEQVPDSNYLMKLAKCTGVRAEWLLTGDGEMYPTDTVASRIIPFPGEKTLRKVTLMDIPLLSSVPAGKAAILFHPEHVER